MSIAILLSVFTSVLFYFVRNQVATDPYIHELSRLHEELEGSEIGYESFFEEFIENVLVLDLIILVAAALYGYVFAGIALRPVTLKMEQQERFSHDVAHELRTPLTALSATLQAWLRDPQIDDVARVPLSEAEAQTERLIALTESLLQSVTHPNEHRNEWFPLLHTLTNASEHLKEYANESGVTLRIESESNPRIYGDRRRVESLCSILLHNAIKFSHTHDTVTARIDARGGLMVRDTGVGITPEALPHVFERFYTTDTARTEYGQRGTGLGLAIAQEIVREHGGSISIASTEGVGTTVEVTFGTSSQWNDSIKK